MKIEKEDFDYIVTPFQEKLSNITALPYWAFWLIFSSILFLIHMQIMRGKNLVLSQWYSIIVTSFLPGLIAIATIWSSKALERFTPSLLLFVNKPREDALEWYAREIRSIFHPLWMSAAGAGLIPVCLVCTWKDPLWEVYRAGSTEIGKPEVILMITASMVGFLGGALLFTMFKIAHMINDLGKIEKIKVSIYQHPATSVKAIGTLLTKISLSAVGLYIFGISSSIFAQATKEIEIYIAVVVFGAVVMCFFIFPQIKVHQIMARVKHERLRAFSTYVEKALDDVMQKPSEENLHGIRELFEVQSSLNGMGEWPFDTKLVITILSGIAIPLVVVLLQFLFRF